MERDFYLWLVGRFREDNAHIHKDDQPDLFDDWLYNLDPMELIKLANKWRGNG